MESGEAEENGDTYYDQTIEQQIVSAGLAGQTLQNPTLALDEAVEEWRHGTTLGQQAGAEPERLLKWSKRMDVVECSCLFSKTSGAFVSLERASLDVCSQSKALTNEQERAVLLGAEGACRCRQLVAKANCFSANGNDFQDADKSDRDGLREAGEEGMNPPQVEPKRLGGMDIPCDSSWSAFRRT